MEHQAISCPAHCLLSQSDRPLSWENDVLKQDLITWQDAKKKGTKRIRDCGAEGFKKAIAGLEVMGLGERLKAGSVPAFRALKPWP